MEKPKVSSMPNIVDLEDDHHLSSFTNPISCHGSSKTNAISVEQYTDARDLHFSIKASLLGTTTRPPPSVINLDDYDDDDDDDVKVLNFKPSPQTPPSFGSRRKRKENLPFSSFTEVGQSSNSKNDASFMCEICVEPKPMNESFNVQGCAHSYCTDCITKYVASKLQDNVTSIRCPEPNCPGLLEPEHCRGILPQEVFDRWGNALCESVLLASEKFYCPHKDCSALMILDGDGGEEAITESECPYCKRLFCVQCKSAWHPGFNCKEFQGMNKDEREKEAIMLNELAKKKKWKRCPNCRFYVARRSGCNSMSCRCGCRFCYKCGEAGRCVCARELLANVLSGVGTLTPPRPMGFTPSPMGGIGMPPLPRGFTSSAMGRTPLPVGRTYYPSAFTERNETRTSTMPTYWNAIYGDFTSSAMGRTPLPMGQAYYPSAPTKRNDTKTSTLPNYYNSNAIYGSSTAARSFRNSGNNMRVNNNLNNPRPPNFASTNTVAGNVKAEKNESRFVGTSMKGTKLKAATFSSTQLKRAKKEH